MVGESELRNSESCYLPRDTQLSWEEMPGLLVSVSPASLPVMEASQSPRERPRISDVEDVCIPVRPRFCHHCPLALKNSDILGGGTSPS